MVHLALESFLITLDLCESGHDQQNNGHSVNTRLTINHVENMHEGCCVCTHSRLFCHTIIVHSSDDWRLAKYGYISCTKLYMVGDVFNGLAHQRALPNWVNI